MRYCTRSSLLVVDFFIGVVATHVKSALFRYKCCGLVLVLLSFKVICKGPQPYEYRPRQKVRARSRKRRHFGILRTLTVSIKKGRAKRLSLLDSFWSTMSAAQLLNPKAESRVGLLPIRRLLLLIDFRGVVKL